MNRPSRVVVTGASGFVGSEVVRQLLESGRTVRGTVRNVADPGRYAFLTQLPGAENGLELVAADLARPESFVEAVAGCDGVIHTASPYIVNPEDAERDLVRPAVDGTLGVLEAAAVSGSVRRVVITSSMAAISDEPREGHVFTEADWNASSSLTRNPYYFSKAEAERAAWRFVREARSPLSFDIVVINPFMVIGPSVSPKLNTSNGVIRDILMGQYPGLMSLSWGFVDVRDVARAHLEALDRVEAEGRFLVATESRTMKQVVRLLRARGYDDGFKLPRLDFSGAVGTWLAKSAAWTQPSGTRSFLKTHLGKVMAFDNRKARNELGLSLRPVDDTIVETVEDLLRWGHLERESRQNV